jgi:UDPglucose 6-dehydrogenase
MSATVILGIVNPGGIMSQIAVIGTGYVGLTTGAYLAHLGHHVICADVVEAKVAMLRRGEMPIVEAGLEQLVRDGLEQRRLSFVLGASSAVADAEYVFLCLPTPQDIHGFADVSYVEAAAREIAPHLRPGAVVINKSTVPVGSVGLVASVIGRADVAVVSNPEFLREGTAVQDCLHPDRIVIGGDDPDALRRVAGLYAAIDAPFVLTDATSAETIKYASNAFLATKVSFINAIANLCEAAGADVREVIRGMGFDRRIGFEFLKPGPGWGGSCLPKDTQALVRIAEEAGYDFALLRGVIQANAAQQETVIRKVERLAGGTIDSATISVWGLAFKAGTDDLRDSPSLAVIRHLLAAGARVRAFDPAVLEEVEGVEVVSSPYEACRDADVLVVLTEWPQFAELDLPKVAQLMNFARIVDARNIIDPDAATAAGFVYEGIGIPTRMPDARPVASFGLDVLDLAEDAA